MENCKLVDLDGNQVTEEMIAEMKEFLEKEGKTTILGPLENNDAEWTSEDFDEIKEFF